MYSRTATGSGKRLMRKNCLPLIRRFSYGFKRSRLCSNEQPANSVSTWCSWKPVAMKRQLLGRKTIEKQFQEGLEATNKVEMLSARTGVNWSDGLRRQ